MAKKWVELTPEQKREERYQRWLSAPGVKFSSSEAENKYKQRVQRLISAYKVTEPDRVPVSLPVGATPAYLAGTDLYNVMYDYRKLVNAWKKFNDDFGDMDTFASPAMVLPGRVYDLLQYKLYSWPGHGLAKDATGIQFVEGEYMMADEYDALIKNPSDFWQRTYIPRIFGAFEAFKMLQPLTSIIELPAAHFMPYTNPQVRAAQQTMIDVGIELEKWSSVVMKFTQESLEAGYPMMRGGLAKAPFDILGDTLRGTKGIITDMYRQPEKLLEAIDAITKIHTDQIIASANAMGSVSVIFPLHKGADGFMSQKQFDKFYWPSLKKILLALINEGLLPILFAEGSYMSRLDSVNEFPKGAVAWIFDKTDMAVAKRKLGDKCCLQGNVPTSLIITGTPRQVKDYCRKLIEDCGKGGGYILAGGASVDKGNPDNLRAMMEAAKEFGVYRK